MASYRSTVWPLALIVMAAFGQLVVRAETGAVTEAGLGQVSPAPATVPPGFPAPLLTPPELAEGAVEIAGTRQQCRDIAGRIVRTYAVAGLGDVGRANVVGATPMIMLDEELLRPMPVKLQIFFYLHECGHHALGQFQQFSIAHENEADCWAIRQGRERGLFTRQDITGFAPWLARSRGDGLGHPPGPERVRLMLECFDVVAEAAKGVAGRGGNPIISPDH